MPKLAQATHLPALPALTSSRQYRTYRSKVLSEAGRLCVYCGERAEQIDIAQHIAVACCGRCAQRPRPQDLDPRPGPATSDATTWPRC